MRAESRDIGFLIGSSMKFCNLVFHFSSQYNNVSFCGSVEIVVNVVNLWYLHENC